MGIFQKKIANEISELVYQQVSEQLLAAQKKVLEKRDKQMGEMIDRFEDKIKENVRAIVVEELDKREKSG